MREQNHQDAHRPIRPGAILRELQAGPTANLPAMDQPERIDDTRLEVERDGDRIKKITASCSCGRRIEIACDYEQPAVSE